MGWMHRTHQSKAIAHSISPMTSGPVKTKDTCNATAAEHLEYPEEPTSFKPLRCTIADADLPFVPPHVVSKSSASGLLWIVIDNIVYDCGTFVDEHPGGPDVMQPFWSSDCSWQFRRFHSEGTLHEHGKALRVGRTSGVKNKFKERPRFVGLRQLGCRDGWR